MTEDEKYYQSDEFRQLLQHYEQMVESGRRTYMDADDLCDIAEYYLENNYPREQVEQTIDFALSLHPGATTPLSMKARLALDDGDVILAEQIADSIPDQSDREVYYLRAEILLHEMRGNDAFQYLYELKDTISEELDYYLYDSANLFIDYNDYDHAAPFVMELETFAPNWYKTWELCAELYLRRELCKEALPYLERMLDADPFDVETWCMQGEAYSTMHEHDKALDAIDYALALDPLNHRAMQLKAFNQYFKGNIDDALKIYQDMTERYGGNEHDYLFMSYCLYDQTKFSESYEAITKSLDIAQGVSPDQVSIYEQQALVSSTLGRVDEALGAIDKAEKLVQTEKVPQNDVLDTTGTDRTWHHDLFRLRIYAENGMMENAFSVVDNFIADGGEDAHKRRFQCAQILFELGLVLEVLLLLKDIPNPEKDLTREQARQYYGLLAATYHRGKMPYYAWTMLNKAVQLGTEDLAGYFGDFFPEGVALQDIPYYYYQLVGGDWSVENGNLQ